MNVSLPGGSDIRAFALDAVPSHVMIIDVRDPAFPIVYVNRTMARDHGYEPAELIGQSPAIFLAIEGQASEGNAMVDAIRAGRNMRFEVNVRRKDGSTFWTGMFVGPVTDADGQITHCVAIGADITTRLADREKNHKLQERLYSEMRERERIAIELRLAQKLEAVGRLASGIAHEINTPIQYVGDSLGFLQAATEQLNELLSGYREVLNELCNTTGARDMRSRIEQLERDADLEFVQTEIPRAIERTQQGVGRVAAIVRAMKEFAHPELKEHGAADINQAIATTLTVACNEYKYVASMETRLGELPGVICNVGELNQVLLNLIVNAAHAIEAAGRNAETGRISISTELVADHVMIRVADNGCGIAEDQLEKIFDPFFTTKEVGKGTGQGLAIVHSIIVDKHGGSIDVRSQVGVGATFILSLPLAGRAVAKVA